MSEQDLIQALIDAIDRGDDETTEAAAQACAGRTRLLPALIPLLADGDPDRRWWATRTLALIGGEKASARLVDMLADPDEATRCAAALGLGRAGATQAIPHLVRLFADPSGWPRDSAADALALIGEPALPALVECMSDPRDGIRVRAASALRRILVAAVPRGTHIDIQSSLGRAAGALFRALNDPNYLVHQHAYDALDRMGLLDNIIVK